jgi:dipeptidase D
LKALSKQIDFRLVDITGGTKRNAIPRQSSALLLVKPSEDIGLLEQVVEKTLEGFRNEFTVESNIVVELKRSEIPIERCLNNTSTTKVIDLLISLPNGVQAMCQDIPDLVETSTNLAIITIHNDRFTVQMNSRSSVESALEWALDHIESISWLSRARFKKGGSYPGWKPDISSSLLKTLKQVHKDVLGAEPEIKAIHAGLETGIIGEKFPGMDMVSLGPQIEHPHSPEERVKISSTADFWKLLVATLERL